MRYFFSKLQATKNTPNNEEFLNRAFLVFTDTIIHFGTKRIIQVLNAMSGEPILEAICPCCGASLEVEYGDDPGEISVIGTKNLQ